MAIDTIARALSGQANATAADAKTTAEQAVSTATAAVPTAVTTWLNANVDPVGSAVVVDSSLSISGAAADAKATGDGLSDLKNALTGLADDVIGGNNFNLVDSSVDTVVARIPDSVTFSGNVLTFSTNTTGSNYTNIYIPIEPNKTYDIKIGNASALEDKGYKFADSISDQWRPGGYTTGSSGTLTNTTHPYIAIMCVAASNYSGSSTLTVQEHFSDTIMERLDDLEQDMLAIESIEKSVADIDNVFSDPNVTVVARYSDYVSVSGHNIYFTENPSGSNIVNIYVPIELGSTYYFDVGSGTSLQAYGFMFANTISNTWTNQGFTTQHPTWEFINDGTANKYFVVLLQALSTYTGNFTVTVRKDASQGKKIRVGSGYAYTSILSALKNTGNDVALVLTDNEYDIQQEYIDIYGSSFWTNYSGYSGLADKFMAGLWLEGNRKIIGTGNSTVKMQYSGSNTSVNTEFSLFAFQPNASTVELSNLTIKYSGIRYAIHDDFVPQHAKIIMDGLILDGSPSSNAAIGAGLGIDTVYIINNCVFLNNVKIYDISYHGSTNASTTNKCKIMVTNCMGSKDCAFRWYGASTVVTDCIVNNSKFASIYCEAYDAQQSNENMRLIAYLNEVSA